MRSRGAALALLCLVLGLALRVFAAFHARFTGDESWFWATARNIARLQAAPVFGPPMTGSEANHPGPIFYYLMALPQLLGSSPLLGSLFVAVLHVWAAILFAQLARRARGDRAGVIALAAWAFAPWDVLYADRIWLSCVAPVFGTLLLYAASRARRSAVWQGGLVFLALVCPQLHMSAPVVWVFALVILWLGRGGDSGLDQEPSIGLRWRALAVGLGLAILCYLPPLVAELDSSFANTRAILRSGGGKVAAEELFYHPLRVVGHALFYQTSEIGYHFARGYWTPFDAVKRYATLAGWTGSLAQHGALFFALSIASLLLGTAALFASARQALGALAAARARRLSLEARLHLGLWAGLVLAIGLIISARKEYFPHYTNLLLPVALWPLVALVDSAFGPELRARVVRLLFGLSLLSMLESSVLYYWRVDRLNGLSATLGMVERVLAEEEPVGVTFDGFHNVFAWQMLAQTRYQRRFDPQGGAPIRFRVHNGAPHQGEAPPGSQRFGAVLLERRDLRQP